MFRLNPHAQRFFKENPDARYFYATANTRFLNPRFREELRQHPEPWPNYIDATVTIKSL